MLSSFITSSILVIGTIVSSVFSGGLFTQLAAVANTTADVLNIAPTVPSLSVSGNTGAPSSSFERTLQFTGVAKDENSDADISTVGVVLYRDGNPQAGNCTADPNQCYILSCLLDVGFGTATETHFTCSVSIQQAYAYGTWTAIAKATDLDAATGTRTLNLPVDAFVFGSGTIGGYPPTVPPVTPPFPTVPPTSSVPPVAKPPVTPPAQPSVVTDRITDFYTRIDEPQPENRFGPHHTEAYGEPLRVAVGDTGLLVMDFSTDPNPTAESTLGMIVEVPASASATWITLYAEALPASDYPVLTRENIAHSARADAVFALHARNQNNTPITSLTSAVRVTLVVPEDLSRLNDLGLYYFNRDTNEWERVAYEMPAGTHTVSFSTSRLGEFALFESGRPLHENVAEAAATYMNCLIGIILLLCILLGIIFLMIVTLVRGEPDMDTTPLPAPEPVAPPVPTPVSTGAPTPPSEKTRP